MGQPSFLRCFLILVNITSVKVTKFGQLLKNRCKQKSNYYKKTDWKRCAFLFNFTVFHRGSVSFSVIRQDDGIILHLRYEKDVIQRKGCFIFYMKLVLLLF